MNGTERNDTSTNPTDRYSLVVGTTILTIDLVFALVGVLGNILVCVVITRRANMKTSMNLYLRNLAITDLGVLLVNFPLSIYSIRSPSKGWVLGRFLCLYISPGLDVFFGASIWSITVIAIERYKNIISRKVFVKKGESFKRVTLKIVLIWLVSFAVVAAPLYPLFVYKRANNSAYYDCYPIWPAFMNNFMFKAYAVSLAIFWYLLPLGIITVTYWKISAQLRQSNTFHKTMHGEEAAKSKLFKEEERRRLKQNKKAQRILTPLVVIFAVTMLPLNMLRLLIAFMPEFNLLEKNYYVLIHDLSVLLIVINSSLDPCVYYLCSKEFRVGMKALFSKKGNFLESRDTMMQTTSNSHKTTTRSLLTAEVGTLAAESSM
ncbi:neuromedin-U receptor 2-like [Actinia tenebrosa]|uniref:Neuromedin-U receptor 2-like n=1 Tax=Actinia tenebrosa TaxID=6105 RepID=A0A6P8HGU4_ACTTE|nr:neuromedin-U receptor 2-like [Actinia tenebrosa]